ncbi:MAG: type II secretion system F family protein [Holosporaceae bacterium]|jgi:type IV pilus assembly protein PilC|nr:type II secretion system F family protein [Holosporaceae bacterium]
MPIYRYQILTKDGLRKNGSILADNYKCAYENLRRKHYQPIYLRKVRFPSFKVSTEDMLMFFLHISFQLKCKVNINEAIESFIDFYGNKTLSASLLNVVDALKNGESVGYAFEKCRNIFDDVTIGLLKSTEKTGKTSEVIMSVLNFLKLQTEWKNSVKRTIAYPIFMAVIAILILVLSLCILGPQVAELMQNFSCGEAPLLTKLTLELLPLLWEIIFFLAIAAFPTILGLLLHKNSREILYNLLLKVPKIGTLIVKISLWQFCKILHIALDAKLDFMEALDLAIGSIRWKIMKTELQNVSERIAGGYKISESFSRAKFMPPSLIMALYVGEEGNDLIASFDHASEAQYKEIQFEIKALGQVLSIGLTLFTGFILIFILCGLFYPIYNYVEIAGA